MGFERLLGVLANGLTVLAALTAFVAFFLGARLREAIAGFHRWRACRSISSAAARRLRSEALNAPFQRTRSRELPTVPHLLTLLSDQRQSNGVVDDLSWSSAKDLAEAARGLQEFSTRMADSVLGRVGSAARADAHAHCASSASSIVAEDAGYATVQTHSSQIEQQSACARLLADLGAELLAGPVWAGAPAEFATGEKVAFDSVRVSERRGLPTYGIDGPVADIARGAFQTDWHGLIEGQSAAQLTRRAVDLARADIEAGTDAYNGYFARLLGWRVETAQRHAGRRLHILAGETTFYTWRVLNEQRTRVPIDSNRLLVHHHGDTSQSVGAAHLPVAVSLITADGFLVLRRRSQRARFSPGRIESAANGNPEIRQLPGVACDRTADGLIDLAGAARRELAEELGPVPLGTGPSAMGLIVMSGDEEERAAYLIFLARTDIGVDALRERFQLADPSEGFHESSGELVCLPTAPNEIGQSFDFILTAQDVRPFTRAMTAIALSAQLGDPNATDFPRSPDRDKIRTILR